MTFETPDDVLEHVGVKGMKWGVRKKKPKLTASQRRARTEQRQKVVGRVLLGIAAQLRIFEDKLNRRYDRRVAEEGGG